MYLKMEPATEGGAEEVNLQYICGTCGQVESMGEVRDSLIYEHSVEDGGAGGGGMPQTVSDYVWLDPTIPETNLIHCVSRECTRPADADPRVQFVKTSKEDLRYV